MKFIAQITGQVRICKDGTKYTAIGRVLEVADKHAQEFKDEGYIAIETPREVRANAEKVAAPVEVAPVEVAPEEPKEITEEKARVRPRFGNRKRNEE
jgi:hypothetical protein